jgi:hypothetical protein
MKLLSSSLAVELEQVGQLRPRTADLFVVSHLVPWKAPILALQPLR